MQPAKNRRVFVVGYDVATCLGSDFAATWQGAVAGRAGFRRLTRCATDSRANVVGEIPDWDPTGLPFVDRKEASLWDAAYVFLTMEVCRRALAHSGLEVTPETGPRMGCLIGSALNGTDAYRV
ncbi:MAG TPA: beta-ketoacyl-[acyl-carrier-protein] synthase family protein, partial [Desulfobulbaceae bacterium]|nr:beta-ketoacyl-[acyl-carrier-protein] synthase family protein [Desulfobulbaceae bacterium]